MSPSRGRPRSEYSLATKLATIDVGETLYFDSEESNGNKPLSLERQIGSLKIRQEPFKDREYRTIRMVAVRQHPLDCRIILGVTRTK